MMESTLTIKQKLKFEPFDYERKNKLNVHTNDCKTKTDLTMIERTNSTLVQNNLTTAVFHFSNHGLCPVQRQKEIFFSTLMRQD